MKIRFICIKNIFIRLRLGKGELYIVFTGFVVLLWLHGNLLFFWDTILPFHPTSDTYFYSFTWNQAIFNGLPNTTNEWLSYFVAIFILHNMLSFTLPISQFILIYLLFTFSGVTMYRLIKFLLVNDFNTYISIPALFGALVYMFNFYVATYLLSDFFESWFIYSLLPLIILIFLSGIKKSVDKKNYLNEILYLVILFEIVSVSFWEEPYLIWTIFILFIFTLHYVLSNKIKYNRKNVILALKFISISILTIFVTGLWYIYTYVNTVFGNFKSVSPAGQGGALASYHILINSLTSAGTEPFRKALELIAIYPTYTPGPTALFIWQNSYLLIWSPLNVILFFSACVFLIAVLFPIFKRGNLKDKILSNKLLYGTIFILIFFGLQGMNPIIDLLVRLLLALKFPYISLMYGTNMQFLDFPLIFFYAIAVSKTILSMMESHTQEDNGDFTQTHNKNKINIIDKKMFIKQHIKIIIIALVIVIVIVYPWYMWTPYATPVYNTGNHGEIIPSVVNIPNYVYNMTDYIQENANNSNTLILPTSNNFLTMGFNGSAFADDQYPALMLGAPTLFQTQIAYNNVTSNIENLIYNPLLLGDNLSNYLSELNVKFILLNTDFIEGAGNYYYENITYLQTMLQSQPNIKLVRTFGPLQVFRNMANTGIISIGTTTHFSPTLSDPFGEESIQQSFEEKGFMHYPLPPVTYNITDNGSIILENNRLISTENPVWFVNNNPLSINISEYHYLSITFKTSSPNVSLYVNTVTGFSNSSFGNTILQPLNLSSCTLSPLLYVNSTQYETFIYPLYGQPPMWYSHFNSTHNYTLKSIYLSLSFNHLIANESGSIEITNIGVSKFLSQRYNFAYLASNINNKDQVLVPNSIYTNTTSLGAVSVNFNEINPTKYVAKVSNATTSFILDFKQNFNHGWEIYINGKKSNDSHFTADIYDNGWLITQKGNYTIEIIYIPQQEYNIVTGLSFYSFIIIVTLIVSYQSYIYYNRKLRHSARIKVKN